MATITPVMSIEGAEMTYIPLGWDAEIILSNGEVRTGKVVLGDHPTILKLETDHGFRSYKRSKIERLAFII